MIITMSHRKEVVMRLSLNYEEKEPIFWRVFEEISNNGLVDYDKLHERLISIGKFYAGDAVFMIEYMEKSGKIEQIEEYYHVYRDKSPHSK
jgi:hypothetical protein